MKVAKLIAELKKCRSNADVFFCHSCNGGTLFQVRDFYNEHDQEYEHERTPVLYGEKYYGDEDERAVSTNLYKKIDHLKQLAQEVHELTGLPTDWILETWKVESAPKEPVHVVDVHSAYPKEMTESFQIGQKVRTNDAYLDRYERRVYGTVVEGIGAEHFTRIRIDSIEGSDLSHYYGLGEEVLYLSADLEPDVSVDLGEIGAINAKWERENVE